MTRIQILELPEGASDERPPFVLVVDEYVPQRFITTGGAGAKLSDPFEGLAERIGARAVVAFAETVEIPTHLLPLSEPLERGGEESLRATYIEAKFKAYVKESERLDLDHMDAITDALDVDRLRDWDQIVAAIKEQQQMQADGGHRFLAVPPSEGGLRCSACGVTRDLWTDLPGTPSCATIARRGYF